MLCLLAVWSAHLLQHALLAGWRAARAATLEDSSLNELVRKALERYLAEPRQHDAIAEPARTFNKRRRP